MKVFIFMTRRTFLGLGFLIASLAQAVASPSQQCDSAAQKAARKHGVPSEVMLAITRVETGRRQAGETRPWPWTVNFAGKGYWFETRAEGEDFARASYESGARSFDVGCFQINFRWHGEAFESLETMFEPRRNADYAAQFLARLYAETGSWTAAAGAYHSRTKTYADVYTARFERVLTSLKESEAVVVINNGFPLIIADAGEPVSLGSLVPLSAAAGRSLWQEGGS